MRIFIGLYHGNLQNLVYKDEEKKYRKWKNKTFFGTQIFRGFSPPSKLYFFHDVK